MGLSNDGWTSESCKSSSVFDEKVYQFIKFGDELLFISNLGSRALARTLRQGGRAAADGVRFVAGAAKEVLRKR